MNSVCEYLDYSGRDDLLAGGVRMLPVETQIGAFKVWTKRIGNNPALRMLLLHGGPGATHEYLEAFDSFLPAAGVEYYYYDQLGSAFSDQPDDGTLWEVDRFVDEVEQVRRSLALERDSFVLYGHSWGGILAIEYALAYPGSLKGIVISNMMSDVPVRRAFAAINPAVYITMQGPSELGISRDATLAHWSRFEDLSSIEVPALVIGARYDTMDPAHMEMMAERLPLGQYLYCPEGSHLAMYDDQRRYFSGLVDFLRRL